MSELRIFDKVISGEGLLIPFSNVLQEISEVSPRVFQTKWRIYRGSYGYGEHVCLIEEKLKNTRSIEIDPSALIEKLMTDEEYFEHIEIDIIGQNIRIGTVDSTFHFIKSDIDVIKKIARNFSNTEIRDAT